MVWISQVQPGISPRTGSSLVFSRALSTVTLFGGANHEQGPLSDGLHVYSPQNSTWTTLDSHQVPPRYDHACQTFLDSLVVFGGCGETGPLSDTWVYVFTTGEWRKVEDGVVPCPRTIQYIPVIGTRMFLWGGGCTGFDAITDTSMYILDAANPGIFNWLAFDS